MSPLQPIFWAFVIFAMSYVPIVGGALGMLASALFGLVKFDDLTKPLLLLVRLQAIGVFVGNVMNATWLVLARSAASGDCPKWASSAPSDIFVE